MISYTLVRKVAHINKFEDNQGILETQNGDVVAYYRVESTAIGELSTSILSIPRSAKQKRIIAGIYELQSLVQLESGDFVFGQYDVIRRGTVLTFHCFPLESINLSDYYQLHSNSLTQHTILKLNKLINVGNNYFVCHTKEDSFIFLGEVKNGTFGFFNGIQCEGVDCMKFSHGKLLTWGFGGTIHLRTRDLKYVAGGTTPSNLGSAEYLRSGLVACGTKTGAIIFVDPVCPNYVQRKLLLGAEETHNWIWDIKELQNGILVAGGTKGLVGGWDGNRNYDLLFTLEMDSILNFLELKDNSLVISTDNYIKFFEFRCDWTLESHSYFPGKFKETVKQLIILPVDVPIEMKFEIIRQLALI